MVPEKTDRRVRKTRAVLRTGLEQLMREKSIQDITVKELCTVCDINRGTFYSHYRDVNDLLTSIEAELQTEFEAVLRPLTTPASYHGERPSPAMTALFRFMSDNAGMCRVLLCNNGDMAFVERVKNIVYDRFMEEWNNLFSADTRAASGYTYAFAVSGCIGILQQWLVTDMPLSPAEIAAIVENLLEKGMVAFQ